MKLRHCSVLLLCIAGSAQALPSCNLPGERLLQWPAENPVWEMCYLNPAQSAGPRGSGLEVRDVHYNGWLVGKRFHSPILFAEYTSGTCYRDWKDSNSSFLAEPGVRNQLGTPVNFSATTSCDRSESPTQAYGTCPFQLNGAPHGGSANCFSGVAVENANDSVTLTSHYVAGWYLYSTRFTFYADGSFDSEFGFGNSNGTLNNTTHWHHNYWRFDFDIWGADGDRLYQGGVAQDIEFVANLGSNGAGEGGRPQTAWSVIDQASGRGYLLTPGPNDAVSPANQSGRNFHLHDVIGTLFRNNEYTDRGNSNNLGDCAMLHANLADGENIAGPDGAGTDVVLYYRGGVRDRTNEGEGTQDSMICKRVGPLFTPIGDWRANLIFEGGFE